MIHIYTTWGKEEVDYVEEARKRHEPEVRQISRDALRQLGDAMVIHIFLSNKEQNKTKTLTDKDVYQRVKDEYGWDQASVVKDQIMNISGTAKNGVDELKEKRELMSKGIRGLPDVEPQSLKMKMIGGAFKAIGPISEILTVKEYLDGVVTADENFKKSQKAYEECMADYKNFNSKHFSDMARCIKIQENMILRFQSDMFKAGGFEALDPQNIKKVRETIRQRQLQETK